MRKNRLYFTRASTLQITLAVAFASISAILFASSFLAASSDLTQDEPVLFAPTVTCGANAIRVEATNSGSNRNNRNAFHSIRFDSEISNSTNP